MNPSLHRIATVPPLLRPLAPVRRRSPAHDPSKDRQVLGVRRPSGALVQTPESRKRQRAAALQDAAAPKSVPSWLMLVLALAAVSGMPAEAPPKPPYRDITFIATSDVHYDAFENEDRNDRVRDTLRYLHGVTNLSWPEELGGGPIAPPRGVLVLGDVIDDGDRISQGKHQTPRQWYQFAADFGFDGTDSLLDFPVFET